MGVGQGWIQDFPRGGGLTVMRGAWLWQQLKPLPCVLNVCTVAKFIFLWHLHLFIAARFFASLCIQGASDLDAL